MIDAEDCRGRSPLLNAVKYNHRGITTLFLDKGANSANEDENLKTALHFAVENGNYSMACLLINRNQKLVNAKDSNNMSALHYAAEMGHAKVGIICLIL